MKVLVCGGRRFRDMDMLHAVLDKHDAAVGISLVIHGGARGADYGAGGWAEQNDINCLRIPAKWELHGPAAGPIRNTEMLTFGPDLVIAMPGGGGTADMVKQAKAAGIPVEEY